MNLVHIVLVLLVCIVLAGSLFAVCRAQQRSRGEHHLLHPIRDSADDDVFDAELSDPSGDERDAPAEVEMVTRRRPKADMRVAVLNSMTG